MNVSGGNGNDVIKGSKLSDSIYGKGGDDKIYGLSGVDTLYGGTGNDKLYGNGGNDYLYSGSGFDYLYGGDGQDNFSDIVNSHSYGGSGDDFFNLDDNYNEDHGWTDFKDIVGVDEFEEIWTPENSFNPDLSAYDEVTIKIYGEGGDDYLYSNNYELHNWAINHGIFCFEGGKGNDLVNFEGGPVATISGNGNSVLFDGGSGFDTLVTGTIEASGEYSQIINSYGSDFDNILNYTKNFEHFVVSNGADASLSIEDEVIGNSKDFKITILGSQSLAINCSAESGANLSFYVENEFTIEHAYDGVSIGGGGGLPDIDTHVIGGAGDDSFYGSGVGNSVFQGNSGNDYFDGDDGENTVVFRGSFSQYEITEIGWNTFQVKDKVKGRDGEDTIFNATFLKFSDQTISVPQTGLHIVGGKKIDKIKGGDLSDRIEGLKGNDSLWGKRGNDTIFGGEGNDRIAGDQGDDILWGGKGRDLFIALKKKNGVDTIKDFKKGQDKILVGSLKKIKIKKQKGVLSIFSKNNKIFELENFKGELTRKGKFLL